jgi:hypothetical protein
MSDTLMDIMPLAARGYCCSQILVMLALEAQGLEDPLAVRAVSGLCNGLGQCGSCCGILTGGCCALGLYLGKGSDLESTQERADLIYAEYVEWFRGRVIPDFGDVTCDAILKGGKPDVSLCGNLLAEAWERILNLLVENGYDPSAPRE